MRYENKERKGGVKAEIRRCIYERDWNDVFAIIAEVYSQAQDDVLGRGLQALEKAQPQSLLEHPS